MCRTWRSFAVGLKNEWDFNDQFSDKYCTFGNYKDLKCLNQRTTKEGSKVIMSFWGLRLTFFVWECTCSRNIHTHSLFSIFEKKHPEDKNNVLVHTLVWHSEEKYEINWPWTVFLAEVCFKVSFQTWKPFLIRLYPHGDQTHNLLNASSEFCPLNHSLFIRPFSEPTDYLSGSQGCWSPFQLLSGEGRVHPARSPVCCIATQLQTEGQFRKTIDCEWGLDWVIPNTSNRKYLVAPRSQNPIDV